MNYTSAINWIKKAQDLPPDDGVSAYYDTRYKLWMPSYPEVSGYIVPTLIEAGEPERALLISRWLRKKQLSNGALPASFFSTAIPFVFDTAMAVRGWLEAQKVEYDARTQESIDRAVEWLEWEWLQKYETFLPTHLVRGVWPLMLYGSKHVDSMLDFYLERMHPNGWPERCEDGDPDNPLSHFIVYVARGFFECGLIEPATKIMMNLPSVPSARYNSDWEATSDDVCVPGVAQAAIMFHKLGMFAEAKRGINYLETLSAPWASDPIDGDYLSNAQLSWSAKFIADAFKEVEG